MTFSPFPPTERAGPDIEERLRAVCGHLNVLNAQLVELAAEALATGSWQGWGVRSLAHWLTWQAGISPHQAREVVRLAEARTTHPAVMSAFAAGALSVDQAAMATKAPAYLDEEFAELATVGHRRPVAGDGPRGPPGPPTPAPWDRAGRVVAGWFDDDGRYHLRGELDADHGRIVDAALAEARDALFRAGQTEVSWAEALVEMAQRSLDAAPVERRERFRANWFIDPADPVPARWTDGLAVPDWLRDKLLCDGTVARCSPTTPCRSASAAPNSQVPDRTRRLVLHRDRKCRVPWCTQTRWLQVHHIIHDEHDGPTDTWNLAAICPADHRLHHRANSASPATPTTPTGSPSPTPMAGSSTPPPDPPNRPGHRPTPSNRTNTHRRTARRLGHHVPRPPTRPTTRRSRRLTIRARTRTWRRPEVGATSRVVQDDRFSWPGS